MCDCGHAVYACVRNASVCDWDKKKSEFQREVLWIPNKIWSFTGAMPDVSEGNVTLAELRGF